MSELTELERDVHKGYLAEAKDLLTGYHGPLIGVVLNESPVPHLVILRLDEKLLGFIARALYRRFGSRFVIGVTGYHLTDDDYPESIDIVIKVA
jgi:hypothetical protein